MNTQSMRARAITLPSSAQVVINNKYLITEHGSKKEISQGGKEVLKESIEEKEVFEEAPIEAKQPRQDVGAVFIL
ncbi:MAG: hypothetical protein WC767_03845 [Candidatus Paceibacterota bacterium]|jgi:hypothetical protein